MSKKMTLSLLLPKVGDFTQNNVLKLGDAILVEDGALISVARLDSIHQDGRYPYVKAVINNQKRQSLGDPTEDDTKSGNLGWFHISVPTQDQPYGQSGLRFCLIDDEEYQLLAAHADAIAATATEAAVSTPVEVVETATGSQPGGNTPGFVDSVTLASGASPFDVRDTNKDGVVDKEEKRAAKLKNQ